MRILVADKFSVEAIEEMASNGHDVEYSPDLDAASLGAALEGFQAVVVRSTVLSSDTIESNDALELIVRAGAGTNTIDIGAATVNSVTVCNTPGKNAVAVAELALGLMLAIDRSIPDNVADLRAGVWNKQLYSQSRGLKGRKLGIVGFGDIGIEVAKRAAAFGLEIHTVDRSGRSETALEHIAKLDVTTVKNLEELFSAVDIISLHVPSIPQTVGMLGAELLAYVRPGSVIINTSRGDVVDEDALLAVIDDKDLHVGTDVYGNEPGAGEKVFVSALAQHPRVYGTHHIGASTEQSQQAVADEVVKVIGAFAVGSVRNQVLA